MTSETKTTSGAVRGLESDGVHAFLGIPFAADPSGDRRFLAPQAAERWEGTRGCDAYGASAPQPAQGFTIIPEPIIPGDNCLNVNVFTPTLDRGARLPVMLYIHGGGFTNGCNASPWYDGRRFAADGIVVAAINYRLGIEGFLPIRNAPTNRAVLDWLAALDWVHDNIANFGGDATNMTLVGQSAGGVACGTLLTVPKAAGAFKRAILMSGVPRGSTTEDEARPVVEEFARRVGVEPTVAGFASVPRDRLIEEQQAFAPGGSGARFECVVDGDVLPEAALKEIARGVGADVDVLVGCTAEEVTNVARQRFGDADERQARKILDRMGVPASAIDVYFSENEGREPWRAIGRGMTENAFRNGVVRLLDARTDAGATGNTFAYDFQWRSPTGFGAVHCLDVPFVFDVLDAEKVAVVAGDDPPRQLADDVHGAWVRFIVDGNPGWPAYAASEGNIGGNVMAFNAPSSALIPDPYAEVRERYAL